MAKIDVLDVLRSKNRTPSEFNFDGLWIPPINTFLTQADIDSLRNIATSPSLMAKIDIKYKMIDDIMRNRGFKRFSAGTNRVVYSFLESDMFVVKIAVDKVGMQDNPLEYKNQFLLKPYCTKMFYVSSCGTVGFSERVLPIKNKAEFKEIASDVFDILVNKILGKYVIGDVGSKYFLNWGIRKFDGPVLLDFPYCYKLDGKKLFCNKQDPSTGAYCDGEIDYDIGFNHLVCTKCGKKYMPIELKDNSNDNKIIIKGGIQMKVVLKKGDQVLATSVPTEEYISRPTKRNDYNKLNGLTVKAMGGSLTANPDAKSVGCTKPADVKVEENVEPETKDIKKETKKSSIAKKTSNQKVDTHNIDKEKAISEKDKPIVKKTVNKTTKTSTVDDVKHEDANHNEESESKYSYPINVDITQLAEDASPIETPIAPIVSTERPSTRKSTSSKKSTKIIGK